MRRGFLLKGRTISEANLNEFHGKPDGEARDAKPDPFCASSSSGQGAHLEVTFYNLEGTSAVLIVDPNEFLLGIQQRLCIAFSKQYPEHVALLVDKNGACCDQFAEKPFCSDDDAGELWFSVVFMQIHAEDGSPTLWYHSWTKGMWAALALTFEVEDGACDTMHDGYMRYVWMHASWIRMFPSLPLPPVAVMQRSANALLTGEFRLSEKSGRVKFQASCLDGPRWGLMAEALYHHRQYAR